MIYAHAGFHALKWEKSQKTERKKENEQMWRKLMTLHHLHIPHHSLHSPQVMQIKCADRKEKNYSHSCQNEGS